MVLMRYIICLVLWRKFTNTFRIIRSSTDIVDSNIAQDCTGIFAYKYNKSEHCICTEKAPIFMSINNTPAKCQHLSNYECNVSYKPYLITPTLNINPAYLLNNTNCSRISSVVLWNFYPPNQSSWIDIYDIWSKTFTIDGNITTLTQNIDTDTWSGHLIRLNFDCGSNCLVFRFKGETVYPFDPRMLRASNNKLDYVESRSEPSLGLIVVIIIASLVLTILIILLCVFRRKIPCEQYTPRKRENSAGSTRSTERVIQVRRTENALTLSDPWYQINKFSAEENYSQFVGENDTDSFYIPTIKGFSRERNSKNRNICELNFTTEPTPPAGNVEVQNNPYKDSAS